MIIAGESNSLLVSNMTTEVLNESNEVSKQNAEGSITTEVEPSQVMDTTEQEDGEVSDASSVVGKDDGEILEQEEVENEEQVMDKVQAKEEDDDFAEVGSLPKIEDDNEKKLEKTKSIKFRTKSKGLIESPVHDRKDREKKDRQTPVLGRTSSPKKDNDEDRRQRKRRWEEHLPEERFSPRGDTRQRYVRDPSLSPGSHKFSEPQRLIDNPSTLRQRVEKVANITEPEVTALTDSELRSMIMRTCELEKEQIRIYSGRIKQIEVLHSFFKTAKEDIDRLFALIPSQMRPDIVHVPGYTSSVNRREESPAVAVSSTNINGLSSQQGGGSIRGVGMNTRLPIPNPYVAPPGISPLTGISQPSNLTSVHHNILPPHNIPPPNIRPLSGIPSMGGMMPPPNIVAPSVPVSQQSGASLNAQSASNVSVPSSSGSDVRVGTGNVAPSTSQPSQDQTANPRTTFLVAPSLLNRGQSSGYGTNPASSDAVQSSSSVPQSYLNVPPPTSAMPPAQYASHTGNVSAPPYNQVGSDGLSAAPGLPNLSKPPPIFPTLQPDFSIPPPSSTAGSSSVVSGTPSMTVTSTNRNVQTNLTTSLPPGASSPVRNPRKSPIPAASTMPPVNLSVPPPMFNLPPPRTAVQFTGPPPTTGLLNLSRPPPAPQGTVPNLVPGPVPNMNMAIPPSINLSNTSLTAPPNLSRPPPNLSFPPPSIRPNTNIGTTRQVISLTSNATPPIAPTPPIPRMTVPPPTIASMSVPPPSTATKKITPIELTSVPSTLGTPPSTFQSFASPSQQQQAGHFTNRTPSQSSVNVEVRGYFSVVV
uniref:WW domain-containing protein n=1 Tax=Syphacia muris TaxID=451379 RepID=A0A0N5A8U4_9BILA